MMQASLPIAVNGHSVDVLDGRAMHALLSDLIPSGSALAGLDDVAVQRCWPVGAPEPTGFVLEWAVRVKGRRYSLYGECGRRKQRPSRMKSGTNAAPPDPTLTPDGVRGLNLRVGESDLCLRSPDQDELLPQLSSCLDGKLMEARLRAFGLRSNDPSPGRHRMGCRLGGYRPGRRATVRFKNGSAPVNLCGKTFRDERGKELVQRHLRASAELRRVCGHRVRVPAPVGYDESLKLAIFVWMPGVRAETIAHGTDELIRASVNALASIHELPASNRDTFSASDESAVIDRWRHCIKTLVPSIEDEVNELADVLIDALARIAPHDPSTIHRDFYEKQIIVSPECTTVLDLDTLAIGDVCVDLGNFVAHLMLRDLLSGRAPGSFTSEASRFLSYYEERRGAVALDRLAAYAASSLFRLGAVHALRTLTAHCRPALWQAARHLIQTRRFDPTAVTRSCGPVWDLAVASERERAC